MKSSEVVTKVYLEVVKQLRNMITEDSLKPGDKLPSERELSERLNAGRSSVREALRALELLGLIETKRGEGTFIRDFKGHHLIPLLSTFILQDEESKRDIKETKYLIEQNCLALMLKRADMDVFLTDKRWNEDVIDEDDFFLRVVEMAENHLLLRIWVILADYYNYVQIVGQKPVKKDYARLLTALSVKDEKQITEAYQRLRGMSNE
ncbi:FadR/GntR family transcriptional regulator [Bacillus tuaregi]|uniref:FadR/GntR family transcriptional regulator n=1 Tax=Bacillus tuaregi TaxID=1816695 RepID=UPI000B24A828|nr:GntR family transcriptional regulator [Bacillus tuaregi]